MSYRHISKEFTWSFKIEHLNHLHILCSYYVCRLFLFQIVMLSLAYKLDAKTMGFFTLAEWLKGMTELQYVKMYNGFSLIASLINAKLAKHQL